MSGFRERDPSSSVETAPLALARNRTANGGWEWWIEIGGERLGELAGVGIFTDHYAQVADVLPRLLARVREGHGETP